jgi:hypothetical protein
MTQPSVEEDPGVQTRLLPVEDRQIVVRQLNDTQLLLLGRETQLLVKESTPSERKLKATGILMDLLEAAIVQEEDVEYIRDMIIKGKVDLKIMLTFVSVFKDEPDKPRVRRGRPPKRATA